MPRPDAAASDVGPRRDAGAAGDAGPELDAGPVVDAGAAPEGGPARDAAPARDAGPGPDAAADAGDAEPDAATVPGDVLFADDFDDDTFLDDWEVRHGVVEQRDGYVVSGPSCMWTGFCPEGPALLATRELYDVGDGELTLDYDVYTGVNAQYVNRVVVDLQAEVGGARIEVNADGSTRLLDPLLRVFWHIGGTEDFHTFEVCARCFRPDNRLLRSPLGGADDTWYHVTARFCGAAGMGVRLVTAGGLERVRDFDATLDATPPSDARSLYLLLWIEGPGKRIDNLVIRRGCDPG